ncbi:ribonuclease H-like domain-containing protein, partial [Tanacetum coccineum]
MCVHISVHNSPHNSDDEDINDSAALTVVSVKLKGTKNYQVWSCAMLLALEGKNKTIFIDGSCVRIVRSYEFTRKFDSLAMLKQFDALVELPRCTCYVDDGFKKHNPLNEINAILDGSWIASGNITETSQRSQTSAFTANVSNRGNYQRSQVSNNIPRPSNTVRPNNNGNKRTVGGSNIICENYGFNGHAIDRCFKITGYPPDFGKKK